MPQFTADVDGDETNGWELFNGGLKLRPIIVRGCIEVDDEEEPGSSRKDGLEYGIGDFTKKR